MSNNGYPYQHDNLNPPRSALPAQPAYPSSGNHRPRQQQASTTGYVQPDYTRRNPQEWAQYSHHYPRHASSSYSGSGYANSTGAARNDVSEETASIAAAALLEAVDIHSLEGGHGGRSAGSVGGNAQNYPAATTAAEYAARYQTAAPVHVQPNTVPTTTAPSNYHLPTLDDRQQQQYFSASAAGRQRQANPVTSTASAYGSSYHAQGSRTSASGYLRPSPPQAAQTTQATQPVHRPRSTEQTHHSAQSIAQLSQLSQLTAAHTLQQSLHQRHRKSPRTNDYAFPAQSGAQRTAIPAQRQVPPRQSDMSAAYGHSNAQRTAEVQSHTQQTQQAQYAQQAQQAQRVHLQEHQERQAQLAQQVQRAQQEQQAQQAQQAEQAQRAHQAQQTQQVQHAQQRAAEAAIMHRPNRAQVVSESRSQSHQSQHLQGQGSQAHVMTTETVTAHRHSPAQRISELQSQNQQTYAERQSPQMSSANAPAVQRSSPAAQYSQPTVHPAQIWNMTPAQVEALEQRQQQTQHAISHMVNEEHVPQREIETPQDDVRREPSGYPQQNRPDVEGTATPQAPQESSIERNSAPAQPQSQAAYSNFPEQRNSVPQSSGYSSSSQAPNVHPNPGRTGSMGRPAEQKNASATKPRPKLYLPMAEPPKPPPEPRQQTPPPPSPPEQQPPVQQPPVQQSPRTAATEPTPPTQTPAPPAHPPQAPEPAQFRPPDHQRALEVAQQASHSPRPSSQTPTVNYQSQPVQTPQPEQPMATQVMSAHQPTPGMDSPVPASEKKRRGRPRKKPPPDPNAPPKKRGRPPKSRVDQGPPSQNSAEGQFQVTNAPQQAAATPQAPVQIQHPQPQYVNHVQQVTAVPEPEVQEVSAPGDQQQQEYAQQQYQAQNQTQMQQQQQPAQHHPPQGQPQAQVQQQSQQPAVQLQPQGQHQTEVQQQQRQQAQVQQNSRPLRIQQYQPPVQQAPQRPQRQQHQQGAPQMHYQGPPSQQPTHAPQIQQPPPQPVQQFQQPQTAPTQQQYQPPQAQQPQHVQHHPQPQQAPHLQQHQKYQPVQQPQQPYQHLQQPAYQPQQQPVQPPPPQSAPTVPAMPVALPLVDPTRPVDPAIMEQHMRALVETMRFYQQQSPQVFQAVWDSVRKEGGSRAVTFGEAPQQVQGTPTPAQRTIPPVAQAAAPAMAPVQHVMPSAPPAPAVQHGYTSAHSVAPTTPQNRPPAQQVPQTAPPPESHPAATQPQSAPPTQSAPAQQSLQGGGRPMSDSEKHAITRAAAEYLQRETGKSMPFDDMLAVLEHTKNFVVLCEFFEKHLNVTFDRAQFAKFLMQVIQEEKRKADEARNAGNDEVVEVGSVENGRVLGDVPGRADTRNAQVAVPPQQAAPPSKSSTVPAVLTPNTSTTTSPAIRSSTRLREYQQYPDTTAPTSVANTEPKSKVVTLKLPTHTSSPTMGAPIAPMAHQPPPFIVDDSPSPPAPFEDYNHPENMDIDDEPPAFQPLQSLEPTSSRSYKMTPAAVDEPLQQESPSGLRRSSRKRKSLVVKLNVPKRTLRALHRENLISQENEKAWNDDEVDLTEKNAPDAGTQRAPAATDRPNHLQTHSQLQPIPVPDTQTRVRVPPVLAPSYLTRLAEQSPSPPGTSAPFSPAPDMASPAPAFAHPIAQPINRQTARRINRYNPSTIAHDLLRVTSRHPTAPGLNQHLQPLRHNLSPYINWNTDLASVRWDLLDPPPAADPAADADDERDPTTPFDIPLHNAPSLPPATSLSLPVVPRRRGRPPKNARPADAMPPIAPPKKQKISTPKFKRFPCFHPACAASLHNIEALRAHTLTLHTPPPDAARCLWSHCGHPAPPNPATYKPTDYTPPLRETTFDSADAWRAHLEEHVAAVREALGPGPAALPSDSEQASDVDYLSDVTPAAKPAPEGHVFRPPPGFKATKQFKLAHGQVGPRKKPRVYEDELERVRRLGGGWEGDEAAEWREPDTAVGADGKPVSRGAEESVRVIRRVDG